MEDSVRRDGRAAAGPEESGQASCAAATQGVWVDAEVRLDGFHAVKHALRFGARMRRLVTPAPAEIAALCAELAPDLDLAAAGLEVVGADQWARLTVGRLPSPLLGWADAPGWRIDDVGRRPGPVVTVEEPRHLGNLGAVVRVAAAADAAGVLVLGTADPLHPTAVRGAAGLQWALPVLGCTLDDVVAVAATTGRELVALDERGESLGPSSIGDAVLLLGSERHGLSPTARAAASRSVRIPMRPGVASLNLATAAAVALYAAG